MSNDVIELARRFKYANSNLINDTKPFWQIRKTLVVITFSILLAVKNFLIKSIPYIMDIAVTAKVYVFSLDRL